MFNITVIALARKLWINAFLALSTGIFIYSLFLSNGESFLILAIAAIASAVGSLPAFGGLVLVLPIIRWVFKNFTHRIIAVIFFFVLTGLIYGTVAAIILESPFADYGSWNVFMTTALLCSAAVFGATLISFMLCYADLKNYFFSSSHKNHTYMQPESQLQIPRPDRSSYSNKTWIKALVTAGLILLMLTPMVYVSNLVEERQARQVEVKDEVSSKWAGTQTITFPYLFIPYHVTDTTTNGKKVVHARHFIVLPEDLDVKGTVSTEERQRSIYHVLLYSSDLSARGNFIIHLPDDADVSAVDWNAAKICVGISDFKGIGQKVTANVNNASYELTAGLPVKDIDETGLSSPVMLRAENLDRQISFELPLKIKGSDQLHFVPLAGASHFSLRSAWNSPSFDGNTLPAERRLGDSGFEAVWNFNKANLPFNTTLKEFNLKKDNYAFGVSLLQPTDQYAKTMRCVKYAILFIGLTFSLFFIVEIMQKKPFHPVQYVLVGMALIVFYTLLLSVSEFLSFDIAYLIASAATVSLIALYAKGHFKSWKVAGVFAGVIGFIYAFIFVLIRLEDSALLVGSVGLFIILALGMYVSRKVNWYGDAVTETAPV